MNFEAVIEGTGPKILPGARPILKLLFEESCGREFLSRSHLDHIPEVKLKEWMRLFEPPSPDELE
jgi:hypothetical protein